LYLYCKNVDNEPANTIAITKVIFTSLDNRESDRKFDNKFDNKINKPNPPIIDVVSPKKKAILISPKGRMRKFAEI
jgi:hypothetical protein